MDSPRSRLDGLREQIRLAKDDKERLSKTIAAGSTDDFQKQLALRRYKAIIGDLKGMASDLETAIASVKRAFEKK